jgi:hypothetical protein
MMSKKVLFKNEKSLEIRKENCWVLMKNMPMIMIELVTESSR